MAHSAGRNTLNLPLALQHAGITAVLRYTRVELVCYLTNLFYVLRYLRVKQQSSEPYGVLGSEERLTYIKFREHCSTLRWHPMLINQCCARGTNTMLHRALNIVLSNMIHKRTNPVRLALLGRNESFRTYYAFWVAVDMFDSWAPCLSHTQRQRQRCNTETIVLILRYGQLYQVRATDQQR